MGEELDVPIKEFSPKNSENTYIKYGSNQVQGWKKSMEDYIFDFTEPDKEKFLNVFGIFDGHGGGEVAKYLSNHFMEFLKKNENFKIGKFKEALTETFFELDKSFKNEEVKKELEKYYEELKPSKEQEIKELNNLCEPGENINDDELDQIRAFHEVFEPRNIENGNIADFSGATGIIIFLGDKNLYIANAGNSRCLVINKEGVIINKTKDHTMNDPEEKKRVELARSFNEDEEKKRGEDGQAEYLESTRGFGDWEFKGNEWIDQKDQEVSVEPEILEVPIINVQYLIIGSHGMFENNENENDEVINNQVNSFFMDEIKKDNKKPYSNIIQEYFEKIIAEKNDGNNNKGLDNMSCIFINLINEPIVKFVKKIEKEEEERRQKEEEEKKKKKEEEQKEKEEKRKKEEEERKKKEEERKKKEEERKQKEEEEKKKKEEEEKKKKEEEEKEKKEEAELLEKNNKNVEENNNNAENKDHIIEEKKDEQ